jgi:hypothetical protein
MESKGWFLEQPEVRQYEQRTVHHEGVWGNEFIAPFILNFDTR